MARRRVSTLLAEKGLSDDRSIDLEPLMEIRNALDYEIQCSPNRPEREALQADLTSLYSPHNHNSTAPSCPKRVSADRVLRYGLVPRQLARDYFIEVLRRQGMGRDQARLRVVAALSGCGAGKVNQSLSINTFLRVGKRLGLHEKQSLDSTIRAFVERAKRLDSVAHAQDSAWRRDLVRKAGFGPAGDFLVIEGEDGSSRLLPRPQLPLPGHKQVSCNDDELWLIEMRVGRHHRVRMTGDMIKRMQRYIARNKRKIGLAAVTAVVTSVVTGLLSGGIATAFYLAFSVFSTTMVFGARHIGGQLQSWRHRRRIRQYDKSCESDRAAHRLDLTESLSYLVQEKNLVESLGAFANLKDELRHLDKLRGKAHLSAKEQILFRRHQVLQQLRSTQLQSAFTNVERLLVETVGEISHYEQLFEKEFETLWQPFETDVSESERHAIFMEAAKKSIKTVSFGRVTQKRLRQWLHMDEKGDSVRGSDRVLRQALANLPALSPDQKAISGAKANSYWLGGNVAGAAKQTLALVGSFVKDAVLSHAPSPKDFLKDIAVHGRVPVKLELSPLTLASACVHWLSSVVGGQALETLNNRLNRVRVRRAIRRAQDSQGEALPFDADRGDVDSEDWRAIRRESVKGVKKLFKQLSALREQHRKIAKALSTLCTPEAARSPARADLVERAGLILQRKALEHEIQAILTGALGHFAHEIVRGEQLQRQLLEDIEKEIPSSKPA